MASSFWEITATSLQKPLEDLDPEKGFIANGGDSLTALAVSRAMQQHGSRLLAGTILASQSLSGLADTTSSPGSKPPYPLGAVDLPRPRSSARCGSPDGNSTDLKIIKGTKEATYHATRISQTEQVSSGQCTTPATRLMPSASTTNDAVSPKPPPKFSRREIDNTEASVRSQPWTITISHTEHSDDVSKSLDPLVKDAKGLLSHGGDDAVLTEMQLELIHSTIKDPGTNIIRYSETYYAEFLPLVRMAWQKIHAIEPIFQTRFPEHLVECGQVMFEWNEAVAASPEQYRALVARAVADVRIGSYFHVITLSQPGKRKTSTVTWTVHHALVDGFSASLLSRKVRQCAAGLPITPGPAFSALAGELKQFQDEHHEEGVRFWAARQDVLASARGDMLLPRPTKEFNAMTMMCEEVTVLLGDQLEAILAASRTCGVTLATMFYAAWGLVLSHYASSDVVKFGAVFASRDLPLTGIHDAVGPMVNTLPLCISIDRELLVREYLRTVFAELVELNAAAWTASRCGFSRDFESALAMQFDTTLDEDDYTVVPIEKPQSSQTTDIPLSIATEQDGSLHLRFHTTRLYRKHVERIGHMFRDALMALCRPTATVGSCWTSLLSVADLSTLRRWGNVNSGLTTKPSITEDLVTKFEKAVDRNPDDVAVECGHDALTYRQLDSAADCLADHLQSFVGPGDVVCTHSDRSISWIIAIYGILKAGAVYCSIDPALPPALRHTLFKVAGAKAFVAGSINHRPFVPSSAENFVDLGTLLSDSPEEDRVSRPRRSVARPADAAYLCFTSGSTGAPKGVLCVHQGLVAFQNDLEVRLFAQPGQRVAQVMSPAFDGSIHELFSALSYGAALILPTDVTVDMFGHLRGATSCILTPSIARILNPTDFPNLKYVYLVGEPVPPIVASLWSRHVALYNMYGPTEGTCGATIKRLLPDEVVTIGKPNPTTRIYIMDEHNRLLPPGVIGEICLAGVQVARGYIGLPKITAERFKNDPVTATGESMYKTGDRGYWSEEGEIVCLGRNDREIKLRGFRLDLNDLEVRIARVEPGIRAVAVIRLHEQLMAVVQPSSMDTTRLSDSIARVLPVYARPARILAVDELPTTQAGKTDHRALAQLFAKAPRSVSQTIVNGTQKKVADTMRSILNLDESQTMHPGSRFDEMGGSSLKQVSLASRLTQAFDVAVPVRLIIENPCVSEIADAIDKMVTSHRPSGDGTLATDAEGITPPESVWLEKYDIDLGSSAFTVFYSASLDSARIDRRRLTEAWNAVLRHHPILRSRFTRKPCKRAIRTLSPHAPRAQAVGDVSLWTEANRPFGDLATSDLIRVSIGETVMVVAVSHVIADFTTLAILLRDVADVYQGRPLRMPGKPYEASVVWRTEAPPCSQQWWLQNLAHLPTQPRLLKPDRERESYGGTSIVSTISVAVYRAMQRYSQRSGVSMQQLALAAVGLVLADTPDGIDVVLGSPYINRPSEDDFGVAGLYLEPLPIRVLFPAREVDVEWTETGADPPPGSGMVGAVSTENYIQAVRKASQQALAYAIPWQQLLALTGTRAAYPSHPLFDVMVSFHDLGQTRSLATGLEGMQPHFVWSEGSKFKLMVEFSAFSDELLVLRLEYDTDIFSPDEIHAVEARVAQALELLVLGEAVGIQGMVTQLSSCVAEQRSGYTFNSMLVFGKAIDQLQKLGDVEQEDKH